MSENKYHDIINRHFIRYGYDDEYFALFAKLLGGTPEMARVYHDKYAIPALKEWGDKISGEILK